MSSFFLPAKSKDRKRQKVKLSVESMGNGLIDGKGHHFGVHLVRDPLYVNLFRSQNQPLLKGPLALQRGQSWTKRYLVIRNQTGWPLNSGLTCSYV